jgi:hypothetical protein
MHHQMLSSHFLTNTDADAHSELDGSIMPALADVAYPLHKFTGKKPFKWEEAEEKALMPLTNALMAIPVQQFPCMMSILGTILAHLQTG